MNDACHKTTVLPLISVVIPVYNAEEHLKECLQSVACQDYAHYETIVVDDGSTDSSFSICQRFFCDGTLSGRLISQKNSGPLLARQTGYSAAKGEYVVHVDSDDELRNDALTQIAKAISVTKADVVLFDYTVKKPYSYEWKLKRESIQAYGTRIYDRDELIVRFIHGESIYLWEKAIKKELLFPKIEDSYAYLRYAEDRLQTCVIYDRAQSLAYVPSDLYYHRVQSTGLDGVFDSRRFGDYCAVQLVVREYIRKWNNEYPELDVWRSYTASTIKWITRRSVIRAGDKQLIDEISHSEELYSVTSDADSVNNLAVVDRIILIALKENKRSVLLLVSALRSVRRFVRSSIAGLRERARK